MKKYFFMAVAAIAALSSCTSDNELEMNQNTDKETLTFTATMENSEATRATYNSTEKCAAWEVGDQISINGKTYSAQEAGTTSTFKADGEGATGSTYNAYFPADLYDGTNATLPAIQTYTAGKFNMPMYATSTTTELAFKNLCAVLAIKVTSADITTLKSIKVASDKKMNGKFTVDENNKAVINDDKGTNVVVLESATAITLDETGTTFYIAIPAQDYQFLNIFLSSDGTTYTQAMATKKATGLGTIARKTIYSIDYAKNATKLWEGKIFIADCNVGATSATEYGGLYTWGGTQNARESYTDDHYTGTESLSGNTDTATKLWGSNWRMLTGVELIQLNTDHLGIWDEENNGLRCTGEEGSVYASNSIFLPDGGYYKGESSEGEEDNDTNGRYWSSTPLENNEYDRAFCLNFGDRIVTSYVLCSYGYSVRAVLEEAADPAPAAPAGSRGTATAIINGVETNVNWVQLWENGPKFAEYNVGATSENIYGGFYSAIFKKDARTYELIDNAKNEWGDKWRTPTADELGKKEGDVYTGGLLGKCTCTWTANYNGATGVNGFLFTGKGTYRANSIFLPAAGSNESIVESDGRCYYWSSTSFDKKNSTAYYMYSTKTNDNISLNDFGGGPNNTFSVRAVLNENAE